MPKKSQGLDFGPYDKDDSEEEETGQNITPKDVKTTTKTKKNDEKKTTEKEKLQALYEKAVVSLSPEEQKEFLDSLKCAPS